MNASHYLPVLAWLPTYPRKWLSADLIAGMTTAAVVIPQSMAYATIAGLPVEVGLYAALVPMLVYALLGRSRVLSVSVTSTISMLTAAALATVVRDGSPTDYLIAASTLAVLVGLFLVLASLLRLGFVANFISIPVLTGFKAGLGIVIIVGQLSKVLGIPVSKGPSFQTLLAIVLNLGQTHWPTFLVALITLAILLLLPRVAPRVPAPLVAVAVGLLASAVLGLGARGVKLVGEVAPGLPSFALPDLSLVGQLWPGALGIALMSFVESIAAGRAFAREDDAPLDANQELLALGVGNAAGGFFQAYPSGGGTSQTTVNSRAGARTQLSSIVTAITVALTLLFLSPVIALMPDATLGALVLVAAVGMIVPGDFRAIARIRREEFVWAIIALVGVVVLGTLSGILLAVAISFLNLLYHANHPPVYAMGRKPGTDVFRPLSPDHPDDETLPGLLMVRTEGRLTFASAPNARDIILALIQDAQPRVVAFDCSAIPDIEYTALQGLTKFEKKLRDQGTMLWLVALNPEPLKLVERAPLGKTLGHERMFFNLEQAMEAYQANSQSTPDLGLDFAEGGAG